MIAWLLAADEAPVQSCQGGDSMQLFVMMGAMFLIMYLLVFRPQRKRETERKAMIAAVKKNDRILTSGGIIGTVTNARETEVTIRIADDVHVKIQRPFISSVLDKGTDEDKE